VQEAFVVLVLVQEGSVVSDLLVLVQGCSWCVCGSSGSVVIVLEA